MKRSNVIIRYPCCKKWLPFTGKLCSLSNSLKNVPIYPASSYLPIEKFKVGIFLNEDLLMPIFFVTMFWIRCVYFYLFKINIFPWYSWISLILYWMKPTLWKITGMDIFLYRKSAVKDIVFESLSCKVIQINNSDFKDHWILGGNCFLWR